MKVATCTCMKDVSVDVWGLVIVDAYAPQDFLPSTPFANIANYMCYVCNLLPLTTECFSNCTSIWCQTSWRFQKVRKQSLSF